jgi:hypothetical protein
VAHTALAQPVAHTALAEPVHPNRTPNTEN